MVNNTKIVKVRQKAPVYITGVRAETKDLSGTITLRRPEERANLPRVEFGSGSVDMVKREGTWIW